MHAGINLGDDFTNFKLLFPDDMTFCFEGVVIDVKNLTAFRFFPRTLRQRQGSGVSPMVYIRNQMVYPFLIRVFFSGPG